MKPRAHLLLLLLALKCELPLQNCPGATVHVDVRFDEGIGPMQMNQMALGQGGLSAEPMWADHVPEIRALRPKLIRLFIQEYFDLLPEKGRFQFEKLDRSVDIILATGAKPLMCICFKPRLLFPKLDQDVVEPLDYTGWEELVFSLVKHYRDRDAGIRYWEIANEPDIGEDGGCPYRFKPESYSRYYQHAVMAILRADPSAHVGGPALAGAGSALLPALLNYCETNKVPLHFVSWHIYSSDPKAVRGTVEHVRGLLSQHPALQPETVLDEWNMDLMNPDRDPRFQPCYICETIWQMKDAKLDYSCYYHIRDWHVELQEFQPFMSTPGAAFMARWWNRMPQFDGLFDYEDQVRPAYYAFELLSRLAGNRAEVRSDDPAVHAFASRDSELRCDNLLLWNFSNETNQVAITLNGLDSRTRLRHITLDALTPSVDENARLRPEPFVPVQKNGTINVRLEPYAVHYWYFE
jgi:hypothetical protein